jgi:phospholipid-binding lipoprotein MlaA
VSASNASSSGRVLGSCLLLLSALAGCATPPTDAAARAAFIETNDPLEPLNRKIFAFNEFVDRILLKPAAQVYVVILPQRGRDAVRRALDNMKEPVIVINNLLQGSPKRAGIAFARMTIDTTVGLAGLFDPASRWGLPKQTGDFGQTLFTWGLPEGPYLVVPVLGPSNPRDLIGIAVDSYGDPVTFIANAKDIDELPIVRFVTDGIDQRARVIDVLDELKKNALDYYAEIRSLARQRRAAELRHGAPPPTPKGFYDVPASARP